MEGVFPEQIHKREEAPRASTSPMLDHSWNWFKYHAEQRLVMIRFYLVVAASLGTRIGYAHAQSRDFLAVILCSFGYVVTFAFLNLDARVSDLIGLGERGLAAEQARFAEELNNDAYLICENAKHQKQLFFYTYSDNFKLIFYLSMILYVTFAVYLCALKTH